MSNNKGWKILKKSVWETRKTKQGYKKTKQTKWLDVICPMLVKWASKQVCLCVCTHFSKQSLNIYMHFYNMRVWLSKKVCKYLCQDLRAFSKNCTDYWSNPNDATLAYSWEELTLQICWNQQTLKLKSICFFQRSQKFVIILNACSLKMTCQNDKTK